MEPPDRAALVDLLDLISGDLTGVDADRLAAGVRTAEAAAALGPEWSGQLIAAMKLRMSWPEVVRRTGVPQTTVWRRAEPYRTTGGDGVPDVGDNRPCSRT